MYEMVIFWAVIISIGVIVWLVLNHKEKQKMREREKSEARKLRRQTKRPRQPSIHGSKTNSRSKPNVLLAPRHEK